MTFQNHRFQNVAWVVCQEKENSHIECSRCLGSCFGCLIKNRLESGHGYTQLVQHVEYKYRGLLHKKCSGSFYLGSLLTIVKVCIDIFFWKNLSHSTSFCRFCCIAEVVHLSQNIQTFLY